MAQETVFEIIAKHRVVPVIAVESPDAAIPLADALIEGELPIAEITFRTAAAAAVMAKLSKERPKLLVGAGTVLSPENVQAAKDSGAKFAVAPGLNPAVIAKAQDLGLPFVPGIATPTDIEQALSLGCSTLKVFPVEVLGGVKLIQALTAPYGHTGVRFVPTGGVNMNNLTDYLSIPSVAAVGGTWLAKRNDIAQGNWGQIRGRCRAAARIVNSCQ